MLELEQQSSYILDFNRETDVSILLKALSVQYEVKETGYWERLIQYIKIMASCGRNKGIHFCESQKLFIGCSDGRTHKRTGISGCEWIVHRKSTKKLPERGEMVYYR